MNSSAIPHCPPGKPISKTQMSAARRDLDWSAASARLLFDGDDANLNIIQFERLPAAGPDRCPPRQPAFCVAERTSGEAVQDNEVQEAAKWAL